MQCNHKIISEHLYDYIDNNLSPTTQKHFEQALSQCESCQSVYQQALNLHQSSHQWIEQKVPEWHRTEYAVRPRQNAPVWLNWGALVTSVVAILMVVFQVQITANDNGVNIAFGSNSNAQVAAIVEQQMKQYKEEQELLLDARFVAENDKQLTINKLMVANAMEKTRDERRDDLNFLVTGIQTQRYEDQNKVEKRLAYLADNQIENNQYINQLVKSANAAQGVNK
jgi:hypothetical protein